MPQSLGELLRQTRLERGRTLEEVSFSTRVHLRYLKALEADDRSALPSAVQARGFLRLIAGYLDVDARLFLDAWEGRLPRENQTDLAISESPAPAVEPPPLPESAPVDVTPPASLPAAPEPAQPPAPARRSAAAALKTIPLFRSRAEEEALDTAVASAAAQAAAAQDIFHQVGLQLRQQREALSLSLADVEQHTHIRENNLRALEDGRIADIASPVQARGMLSNLADFLNLDREALLNQFAEALLLVRQSKYSTPAPAASVSFGRPQPEPAPQPSGRGGAAAAPAKRRRYWVTPDLLIASVVLVGMVLFIIWGVAQILTSSSTSTASAPSVSDVLLISGSITPEPLASQTQSAEVQITQDGAVPAAGITDTPPALPTSSAPLQVNVIARQRAWMRVTADGKEQFNARVVPGNVYSFSASERLELECGSARAIDVYWNGSSLGELGVVGQVVGLVFTLNGMQTPTPAFTPTPTATQPATLTPRPSPTVPAPTITPLVP